MDYLTLTLLIVKGVGLKGREKIVNKHIEEIDFIRGIAALSVVLIHSISVAFEDFGIRRNPDYPMVNNILFVIQMLLIFATPMFVFISELVLARNYKTGTPKGFWGKRIKFILLPYISMGVFYSLWSAYKVNDFSDIHFVIIKKVLLGDYHGYFILIIFQFYALHFIFTKYIVGRIKAKYVIGLSLLINAIYLIIFNFLVSPAPPWYSLYKLPFLGWLAYFTLAFYCGRNFERFQSSLKRYNKLIVILPFIMGLLLLLINFLGILITITSQRVDVIFYTISVAFFLFYVATHLAKVPNFILMISQYSFGIYLLHPFIQGMVSNVTFSGFSILNLVINIIVYLITGVVLSAVITKLLNYARVGPFLVGKVKKA